MCIKMEIEDIIKLDEYAGIKISVEGCFKLLFWSSYETKKSKLYVKLSSTENSIHDIIENRMKDRHLAIAKGLIDRAEDSMHLADLLTALAKRWTERLNSGVKL